jgi:antitoxin MazE
MKVKIAKWGNSLAIRLPKAVVDEARLKPDTDVDVTVEQGEVRVKRVRPRYTLEGMIAAIKPGTEPTPSVYWGPDVGSEILPEDEYSRGEITPENIHEHAAKRRRHRVG